MLLYSTLPLVLAAVLALYVYIRERRLLGRMRPPYITWGLLWLIVLYGQLPVWLLLRRVASEAVTGVVISSAISIVVGAGTYMLPRLGARKRFVFIANSGSFFFSNIRAGVATESAQYSGVKLVNLIPETIRDDSEEGRQQQLEFIRSAAVQNAHALIITPVGYHSDVSDSLVKELINLIKKGVAVALVDVKVPNRHFYEHNVPMPLFISSDAVKGGAYRAGDDQEGERE